MTSLVIMLPTNMRMYLVRLNLRSSDQALLESIIPHLRECTTQCRALATDLWLIGFAARCRRISARRLWLSSYREIS